MAAEYILQGGYCTWSVVDSDEVSSAADLAATLDVAWIPAHAAGAAVSTVVDVPAAGEAAKLNAFVKSLMPSWRQQTSS